MTKKMAELTQDSLEGMLMQMAGHINSMEERIVLKPTMLIISSKIYRFLMWLPPVAKRRGVRGRKRALMQRGCPRIWGMLK